MCNPFFPCEKRRVIMKIGVASAYLHSARTRGDTFSRPIVVIGKDKPQKRDARDASVMTKPFTKGNKNVVLIITVKL